MYGFINLCVKALVTEKFGEAAWEKVRKKAKVDDAFISYDCYEDDVTLRLVKAASEVSSLEIDAILETFGEYFFTFCQRSGYDEMLRTLGSNLRSFLENLDSLHSYLSFSYKNMDAPSFRCERGEDDTLILHYYSSRKGFHPIVVGIIRAVAKEFFESEVKMQIINQSYENERNGKKEHVVFSILQRKIDTTQLDEGPPKFVAQTRKHSEPFLNKQDVEDELIELDMEEPVEDVDQVMKNLENMKDQGIPLGKRKSIAQIRSLVALSSLYHTFTPSYPNKFWMNQKIFCDNFPFHVVFDKDLKVKQSGFHIQRIMPRIRNFDTKLTMFFNLIHPQIDLTLDSISKFINQLFILETKKSMVGPEWEGRPMLQLRGQMVWMEEFECMVYLCSPRLASLKEMEDRGLHLSDIPLHDVTRDLILFNQQRLAEIELGKQLEMKKEELRKAMADLEAEKAKTDMLLHSMLPRQVADQLREGKRVEAGEYAEVTILFSDIVSFTTICSQSKPIDIVNMLNSLYVRFDKLTSVHDVYKVETIGDAYMVVGGLPVPVKTHTERIANMALGMIITSVEVSSPVTGEPIGIRVGIHSGPALAGVVGEKMPRYCLFGDSVNTASRMESHGEPSKIHLSSAAYRNIHDKGFRIVERGEIIVKGKGSMTTYFLEGNDNATVDEILGRGIQRSGDSRSGNYRNRSEKTDTMKYSPTKEVNGGGGNYQNQEAVIPMYYPDNENRRQGEDERAKPVFTNPAGEGDSSSGKPTANGVSGQGYHHPQGGNNSKTCIVL
ncbi:guanylate cyclase soluble subunit beta-2-like isoform X4 [Ptychodera flava]|uniref:guanylate cyclase soluble subunit beta-2-like isoform X4 n=1 Tax=Ptychodera flava TaxID=63121 RepID=UPI00396A731C